MPDSKSLSGKKILYLITQTKWGGAQKYVLELAEYFAKNNEVHIAYGETDDVNQYFLDSAAKLNVKTIPIKKLVRQIDLSQDIFAVPEILKILNKESYHLIHVNSSKAGFLGSLAARLYQLNPLNTRLRVVYTAHGFVFNEPLSPLLKRLYKYSEVFSTSLQNLVIAVSEYDKASAITHKICAPQKIFVVHNGLDANHYQFLEKSIAWDKLQLDGHKKYFGTIASFYPTKGYRYLIEAVKLLKEQKSPLLKEFSWVFIGSGPEQKNIEKQISENNLDKQIKIIAAKNTEWKYLKAFDCFVLPSVKEGLPYTILEAGLAKIPVIATEVGGVPEILTNEKTGLIVSPGNPLSLMKAMEKINSDMTLAQTMLENNYQNVINNFSLNKTLEETETLYLKMF